jgi:hypothetical protein
MTRLAVAALLLAAVALTACSSPTVEEPIASETPTPTPTVVELTPQETAEATAAQLKGAVLTITAAELLNETNDPNELFGRPNGYVAGAVFYDNRVTCDSLGVECGATLEIWPTAEDAQARSDYIQGILKEAPALGSEYNYLDGASLLRVTGALPPSAAVEYEAAFLAQ